MKKNLPLIVGALALLSFLMRSKGTYRVWETDGPVTYVILKQGGQYLQFGIPTADVGKAIATVPADASVSSAADYAAATGSEFRA
jgi:hypothetical protein